MNRDRSFHLTGAVAAAGVLSFSGVLIETAMNVTFPALTREFGVTTAQIQWVTTIYLLMISIIAPLSSYLARSFSTRGLFLAANLFFLFGVLADCWSPGFAVLLLGRMLQGVGTGIGLPLMFHMILTRAPERIRGTMMGIGTLTTSIAPAVGPTYGGVLAGALNWRFVYLFLIPLLLLSLALGLRSIPAEKSPERQKANTAGVLCLAVTFTGFLSAMSAERAESAALFVFAGALGALLFVRFNRRAPLLRLSVLRNRRFAALLFCFLVYQALLLGISFVLPNYLQTAAGFRSSTAGLFMFPGALAGAVLAPLSGRLLDRAGAKKPILTGLPVACAGLLLLAALLHTNSLALLIGAHLVFMIGLGLSYSNLMTCGLGMLPRDQTADGNAVLNTLQQFAGAVSTAAAASVFSAFQRTKGLRAGTAAGAGTMLVCFFFLLAAGAVCVVFALRGAKSAGRRE